MALSLELALLVVIFSTAFLLPMVRFMTLPCTRFIEKARVKEVKRKHLEQERLAGITPADVAKKDANVRRLLRREENYEHAVDDHLEGFDGYHKPKHVKPLDGVQIVPGGAEKEKRKREREKKEAAAGGKKNKGGGETDYVAGLRRSHNAAVTRVHMCEDFVAKERNEREEKRRVARMEIAARTGKTIKGINPTTGGGGGGSSRGSGRKSSSRRKGSSKVAPEH
jgi:hypothetical protein